MIEVPRVVRRKAVTSGAAGWLDAIDDLVAALAAEWALEVGPLLLGGTESVVLSVVQRDGAPAVLKLLVPRGQAAQHEITTLQLADGEGCVRLLRSDPGRSAVLLERLGPSMHALDVPYAERMPALADLCRRVWRPAAGHGLPTGADKAVWLADHIAHLWRDLDGPCSERTVDHALACAERRRAAHDDERAVLVHGDVHQWNALRRDDGWALVDPDGLLADPAYDVGVLLREDPEELLAGDARLLAHRLAERCGVDAEAAWEWGVVERVSTGLLCEQIGLQPAGRRMLRAAEALAD